jgi:NTP pyrophosphatase (non-canonical NTP hydrolase)
LNWNCRFEFHQPRNLLIALAGEVGELSEIFQWKGSLANGLDPSFTEADKVHIGEEIADVFVYSTRLCDICHIDLPAAIIFALECQDPIDEKQLDLRGASWSELKFSSVESALFIDRESRGSASSLASSRSPRDQILKINSYLGKLCSTFLSHSEEDSRVRLSSWPREDINHVALNVAHITILLSWTAHICGLQLATCVYDKMCKNECKYPISLSKGSSAKYTKYADDVSKSQIFFNALPGTNSLFTQMVMIIGLVVGSLL